jgi:hypothetical protein
MTGFHKKNRYLSAFAEDHGLARWHYRGLVSPAGENGRFLKNPVSQIESRVICFQPHISVNWIHILVIEFEQDLIRAKSRSDPRSIRCKL